MKPKLIVFTGLPGTGKSTVAEAVGHLLQIPVFAKDWLEAVLLHSEFEAGLAKSETGFIAYELLTVLAKRQLLMGQSVILDSVAGSESIRKTWRELAAEYNADWKVIECICRDDALHRRRLQSRQRGIPGWHELTWSDVENVKFYYVPWHEERLALDMASPLEENVTMTLDYLKER